MTPLLILSTNRKGVIRNDYFSKPLGWGIVCHLIGLTNVLIAYDIGEA